MNGNKALGNGSHLYDVTPVIKVLLEHGADPSLYGVLSNPHAVKYPRRPADEVKAVISSLLLGLVVNGPRSTTRLESWV